MSNTNVEDTTVKVYYYLASEWINSNARSNFVTIDPNNDISSYIETRTAVLYDSNGVVSGRIVSYSNWNQYPNSEANISLVRQLWTSLVFEKGTITGFNNIINSNFIGTGILTYRSANETGIYYGKNINFNIELIETNITKITIFINWDIYNNILYVL